MNACDHCWHRDVAQPAMLIRNGSMTAYTCCHCGERKTETVTRPDRKQHGAFHPDRECSTHQTDNEGSLGWPYCT